MNTTKQVRCFSRHAWGAGVALHAEALGVVIPSALTAVSNMPAASETTLERQRRRTWHMGLSENSVPLHPMVNDHYPY